MTTDKPVQPREIPVLDYGEQPEASNLVLPKSASFSSPADWTQLHFEVQQQPAHDTGEHRHQMNIVTIVTSRTPINQSIDGQSKCNLVGQNNAFILPSGALHRCHWQEDIEFMFVGLAPRVFIQVGQELVNPGFEAAGEIISAGAATNLQIGTRVLMTLPYLSEGAANFGAFAEQVAIPAQNVVPIPESVNFAIAAAIPVMYGTAYIALKHRAQLQVGETLLVTGATGATGSAAVQIGKHLGGNGHCHNERGRKSATSEGLGSRLCDRLQAGKRGRAHQRIYPR